LSVPLWVIEAAEHFWKLAGAEEPFPRELRCAVGFAVPVSVWYLPRLRTAEIDDWARRYGLPCRLSLRDRPLRACTVAHDDRAVVLIDSTDDPDEQRFSLAHELGHFLRDYDEPRERARQVLGRQAVEVLDGRRLATFDERVGGVLRGVELEAYVHLMERTPDGHAASAAISTAEHQADLLAYELLAPHTAVQKLLSQFPAGEWRFHGARLLQEAFGFPPAPAARYAALLAPAPPAPGGLVTRLRGGV